MSLSYCTVISISDPFKHRVTISQKYCMKRVTGKAAGWKPIPTQSSVSRNPLFTHSVEPQNLAGDSEGVRNDEMSP